MMLLFLGTVFVLFGSSSADTYVNPVVPSNHPDPGALRLPDGSGFVAVSTSDYAHKGSQPAFPILLSKDLVEWIVVGHVFPKDGWPEWGFTNAWAPEIHYVDGRFNVYFTMRQTVNKILAIGVAVSNSPFGPFEDSGQPLASTPTNGSIDATWFKDPK